MAREGKSILLRLVGSDSSMLVLVVNAPHRTASVCPHTLRGESSIIRHPRQLSRCLTSRGIYRNNYRRIIEMKCTKPRRINVTFAIPRNSKGTYGGRHELSSEILVGSIFLKNLHFGCVPMRPNLPPYPKRQSQDSLELALHRGASCFVRFNTMNKKRISIRYPRLRGRRVVHMVGCVKEQDHISESCLLRTQKREGVLDKNSV